MGKVVTSLGNLRMVLIGAAIAIAAFGGLAIWQLSDDDDESPERPAAAPETAEPLPPLPPRWTKAANAAGGFALGVPPGWSEKESGARTTLRSPGSSVVVAITADRSDEALATDLGEFAGGVLERLAPGAEQRPLAEVAPAAPGYEGAGAVAIDEGATGPGRTSAAGRKRLEAIVVRRTGLAAYPILIASASTVKPAALDPLVSRIVRSLRGRPAG